MNKQGRNGHDILEIIHQHNSQPDVGPIPPYHVRGESPPQPHSSPLRRAVVDDRPSSAQQHHYYYNHHYYNPNHYNNTNDAHPATHDQQSQEHVFGSDPEMSSNTPLPLAAADQRMLPYPTFGTTAAAPPHDPTDEEEDDDEDNSGIDLDEDEDDDNGDPVDGEDGGVDEDDEDAVAAAVRISGVEDGNSGNHNNNNNNENGTNSDSHGNNDKDSTTAGTAATESTGKKGKYVRKRQYPLFMDTQEKLRIARIYIRLLITKNETFHHPHTKPDSAVHKTSGIGCRMLAKEAGIGKTTANKIMNELKQHGGIVDKSTFRHKKIIRTGSETKTVPIKNEIKKEQSSGTAHGNGVIEGDKLIHVPVVDREGNLVMPWTPQEEDEVDNNDDEEEIDAQDAADLAQEEANFFAPDDVESSTMPPLKRKRQSRPVKRYKVQNATDLTSSAFNALHNNDVAVAVERLQQALRELGQPVPKRRPRQKT